LKNIIDVSNIEVFAHGIEIKAKVKKNWENIEFFDFIKDFRKDSNLSFEEKEALFKNAKEKFVEEQLSEFKNFSKVKNVFFEKVTQEELDQEQKDWDTWRKEQL